MVFYISFLFEGLMAVVGFALAIILLVRERRYLGNRLITAAAALIGAYGFFILLYDVLATAWAIQVFLRCAIICILTGVLCIFFTMICMVKSSIWFKDIRNWGFHVGIIVIYAIYLIADQNMIIIVGYNPVNSQISLPPMIVMVGIVLLYLITSLAYLYSFGIKKVEGASRRRMQVFAAGILIAIVSIFTNIASQLIENEDLQVILDNSFFGLLALSVVFLAYAFLGKKTE